MTKIQVEDAEVRAALQKLQGYLSDFTPVFHIIGEQLEHETEERIDQGVTPEGTAFSPKAQATLDAYEARGQTVSVKPLFGPNVDGLPFRRSFFRQVSPSELEIGTNKVQAKVLQFGAAKGAFGTASNGSSIPWGRIPARPYLGISEQDRQNIVATIIEWLEEVED